MIEKYERVRTKCDWNVFDIFDNHDMIARIFTELPLRAATQVVLHVPLVQVLHISLHASYVGDVFENI